MHRDYYTIPRHTVSSCEKVSCTVPREIPAFAGMTQQRGEGVGRSFVSGFTLIEILITVVIIGILATFSFFSVGSLSDYQFDNYVDTINDFIGEAKFAIPRNRAETVSIFFSSSATNAQNTYIATYFDYVGQSCGIDPLALYQTGYTVTASDLGLQTATFTTAYNGFAILAQSKDSMNNLSPTIALSTGNFSHSILNNRMYIYTFVPIGQTPCGELNIFKLANFADIQNGWGMAIDSIQLRNYHSAVSPSIMEVIITRALSHPRIYDPATGNLYQSGTVNVRNSDRQLRDIIFQ